VLAATNDSVNGTNRQTGILLLLDNMSRFNWSNGRDIDCEKDGTNDKSLGNKGKMEGEVELEVTENVLLEPRTALYMFHVTFIFLITCGE